MKALLRRIEVLEKKIALTGDQGVTIKYHGGEVFVPNMQKFIEEIAEKGSRTL